MTDLPKKKGLGFLRNFHRSVGSFHHQILERLDFTGLNALFFKLYYTFYYNRPFFRPHIPMVYLKHLFHMRLSVLYLSVRLSKTAAYTRERCPLCTPLPIMDSVPLWIHPAFYRCRSKKIHSKEMDG